MTRRRGGRCGVGIGAGALAIALVVAATPRASFATTVMAVSTTAQAATADRIFVGTVTAVLSRPKATAPKFETVVTFDVEEVVAGSVPARLDLTFSGGEVGGILQRIDGMPRFAVGERYVVLLESDQQPPLASPLIGFNQGLYRVVGAARETAVVRDRSGQPLPASGASHAGVAASARSAGEPSLAQFLDGLRAARSR